MYRAMYTLSTTPSVTTEPTNPVIPALICSQIENTPDCRKGSSGPRLNTAMSGIRNSVTCENADQNCARSGLPQSSLRMACRGFRKYQITASTITIAVAEPTRNVASMLRRQARKQGCELEAKSQNLE